MRVRVEAVERLVAGAMEGMHTAADDTTGAEVISACLTIALRAVTAVENKEGVRDAIEQMYALLPVRTVN